MTVPRTLIGCLSATATTIVLATAATAQQDDDVVRAIARVSDTDGQSVGNVEFTQAPNGVLVEVLLTDLTPGEHAIHLHETGNCAPDFEAVGGHFAPDGNAHGFLNPDGPHAGDLPNIFVGVDGTVTAHFFNDRVTLDDGDASLMDDDGTAVIVHELKDVYEEEAGAGGRIACGAVEERI